MIRSCETYSVTQEISGLINLFMPEEQAREESRRIIAVLLLLLWGTVTLMLTIESVDAVEPPFYGVLTAIIFLIVGRMWGIEMENIVSED